MTPVCFIKICYYLLLYHINAKNAYNIWEQLNKTNHYSCNNMANLLENQTKITFYNRSIGQDIPLQVDLCLYFLVFTKQKTILYNI